MSEASRESSVPIGSGHSPGPRRSRTDVLIVGAGPTGLALGLCLARWNVPFRLIDRAIDAPRGSRAIGVQARTLELLEQHRVVDALLAAGHRGHAGNILAGTRRIIRIDFDPLDSRYPFLLFVDQSETERVLADAVVGLNGAIERGIQLVAFDQSSQRVSATLEHADGHTESVDAAWLVGTDGAHSTVRHCLGVPFEGESIEQGFVLADLHAEWDLPEDEFHIFLSSEGLTALFPMGGGRYRLIADEVGNPGRTTHKGALRGGASNVGASNAGASSAGASNVGAASARASDARAPNEVESRDRVSGAQASGTSGSGAPVVDDLVSAPPTPGPTARDEAPSLAECEAIVRARVARPVTLSALGWSSRFRIHSRMVTSLSKGRVLLAGDAAHIHSPAGAQGMNTGIQEAMNLAWKLALVQRGAPLRLLDTYHAERHPIERDVLRQTAFVTRMGMADRGWLMMVRDRIAPLLTALGPVRNAARRGISELSVHYRRGPLCFDRLLDGGAQAGDRAPDAFVEVVDGPLGKVPSHARLFDLHDPASFSLFVLLEPGANGAQTRALEPFIESFRHLSDRAGGLIRIWLVADVPQRNGNTGNGNAKGGPQLSDGYGQSRPVFFLWRPDGYLAARGRPTIDGAACLAFCEKWFAAPVSV